MVELSEFMRSFDASRRVVEFCERNSVSTASLLIYFRSRLVLPYCWDVYFEYG